MSFTFSQLKTAIQDFTENSETSFVTNIPVFIRAAEERILKSVDLAIFRKNVTSAFTSSDEFLSTPTDFLAPFSLFITTSGSEGFLLEKDVNFIREAFPARTTTGVPKYYALFDNSGSTGGNVVGNFIVGPTPNSNYAVELHYYYRPQSLTSLTDSQYTWISQNAPNALLYGSLIEAYVYMKGEQDVMASYMSRYDESIARIKDLAEARENDDAYREGLPNIQRT